MGRWPPPDAFFPFPDGLEILLGAGVKAVVQPGGSVRDEEVIAAARAAGVTMYLTGSATSSTEQTTGGLAASHGTTQRSRAAPHHPGVTTRGRPRPRNGGTIGSWQQ